MGLFSFKKQPPLLNEKDIMELKEIERNSYMEEAKNIMKERGKQRAKNELTPQQKKEGFYS